jgi:hypothetical protein
MRTRQEQNAGVVVSNSSSTSARLDGSEIAEASHPEGTSHMTEATQSRKPKNGGGSQLQAVGHQPWAIRDHPP